MMPFTTIYKFMWKDLGLHGAEKEFFAVIYGFWRRSKAPVEIPIKTVTEITGLSRTSVIMAKRALLKKELVAAQEIRGKPTRYEVLILDPLENRTGADYLFGFTIKADGRDYHVSLPGRVIKVLGDEQVQSVRANPEEKNNGALWTAFLLFANQVDSATTFAQDCGGGGSAPDQNWGRAKNEDDTLWARRCFRKAQEIITTPMRRRGMRR